VTTVSDGYDPRLRGLAEPQESLDRPLERGGRSRRGLGDRWSLGVLALLLLSVAVGYGTRPSDEGAEHPAAPTPDPATVPDAPAAPHADFGAGGDYVGSAACAECHAEISASYQGHPMARSIMRVEDDPSFEDLEDQPARLQDGPWVYEVHQRDGQMEHRERLVDAEGEAIFEARAPMHYVVGSGQRAKAYLQHRGEKLLMSPLNWYSDSESWDFAPGYRGGDPRHFDRVATEDCLSCHTGRFASLGSGTHRVQDPPFHEMAIGCEKCHGPGSQHIAWHEGGRAEALQADPILNPEHFDLEQRSSLCYQCHLQAAVRLPRAGRSDLEFQPGDRMEEIWTVMDTEGVAQDGEPRAVSHVQQMRESRCFTASAGRLECLSCHDPHRIPAVDQRVDFYRQRCFECHDDASCALPRPERMRQDDSCVDCHMPQRETVNIAHVTQTDHRVPRVPDRRGAADAEPREESLRFFDQAEQRLPPWERDRSMGLSAWMYLNMRGRTPPASLAAPLRRAAQQVPEDGAVLTALGALASAHGMPEQARAHYEAARHLPEAQEVALAALLNLDYQAAHWEAALGSADRLLAVDPDHARALSVRADILMQLDRPEEAIESAERALERNPTLTPVRQWLQSAYQQAGQEDAAREQGEILERIRRVLDRGAN
jgi:hypothetical protein